RRRRHRRALDERDQGLPRAAVPHAARLSSTRQMKLDATTTAPAKMAKKKPAKTPPKAKTKPPARQPAKTAAKARKAGSAPKQVKVKAAAAKRAPAPASKAPLPSRPQPSHGLVRLLD